MRPRRDPESLASVSKAEQKYRAAAKAARRARRARDDEVYRATRTSGYTAISETLDVSRQTIANIVARVENDIERIETIIDRGVAGLSADAIRREERRRAKMRDRLDYLRGGKE